LKLFPVLFGVAVVVGSLHSRRFENGTAAYHSSLTAPAAPSVPLPSPAPPPRDYGSKMYRTVAATPCAVDHDTWKTLAQVLQERDGEALQALEEQGKILMLSGGTKFYGWSEPDGDGLVYGYVKSGRNIGKACYQLKETAQ
jgi:hypothetical protein